MSEVLTGGIDVTLVMLLWLLAAGALAGWIDAVVGGGDSSSCRRSFSCRG